MVELLLLVGMPGAGKSSFAKKCYPNYVYINQDTIGNRNDCVNIMRLNLKEGKSCIIDRTNISKKQRAYFIEAAKALDITNIKALYIDTPKETCITRIEERDSHPNLTSSTPYDKIVEIVEKFEKDLEIPDVQEGFVSISTISVSDMEFLMERKRAE